MLGELLDALGLSSTQAGLGSTLVIGAIWARRALVAGQILSTAIRMGTLVVGLIGFGIAVGVISLDFGMIASAVQAVLEFGLGPFREIVSAAIEIARDVLAN